MAAWGIENMGDDEYKVVRFPYRWQMKEWVAKKPARQPAIYSLLDAHLKAKAKQYAGPVILRDTRIQRS
jgi:hypothetical protein